MKLTLLTLLTSLSAFVAAQDDDPYRDYGIISPAANTTIDINTPLNLTIAPHRYFKESAKSIDVFILNGENGVSPKAGIAATQVVSGMVPNIWVVWDNIGADGYQVDVNFTQYGNQMYPGVKTVLVQETFYGYGGGLATNYWSQTFNLVAS
ncbi:hypothetical protein L218DRAFT_1005160 [Marasmius fiardii PR-910]|nr:hypothetical protein L218DRAFT_1005160 [Marasmius fiardii PR-910]